MTTIETQETGGAGNTKQPLQLKSWFFTFNNYNNKDIEILETKFKQICKKFCFQEEVGKEGTKHLQGCIELLKKSRWTSFGLNKRIHWEKTNNIDKAMEYCCKEDTRNGVVIKFGFPKEIKIIEVLKPWQKDIEDIFFTEPDGRSIHWYWENVGGVGKSSFCKYMYVKHKALVIQGGKLGDIMNLIFNTDMDRCSMVIIDIPRNNGNSVSYNSIECILNGMITNTKYETGTKVFNPPHVIVFSNFEPDLDKLSEDRWNVHEIGGELKGIDRHPPFPLEAFGFSP